MSTWKEKLPLEYYDTSNRGKYQATLKDGSMRCMERVSYYVGNWPCSKQCDRKAVVTEDRGDGKEVHFCKQHSTEEEKKRDAKRAVKEDASTKKWKHEVYGSSAIARLRAIAEGHNDPRTLAKEFMEKLEPKYWPEAYKEKED